MLNEDVLSIIMRLKEEMEYVDNLAFMQSLMDFSCSFLE